MRTATTAIDKSNTGGICQARVINQAETPASARALPSDNTPNEIASSRRGIRGCSSRTAAGRGSDAGMLDVTRPGNLDDVVTDFEDVVPVADDHHGRTGAGPVDNGPQHAGFGCGVQVRGGLVEQQHRGR